MDKQEYIRILTEQIRCRKAREPVAREVEDHIEDQAGAYLEYGVTREEAEERAVRQMGDPVAAGVELDHIHRPHLEWKLVLLILGLSILGILVQLGVSESFDYRNIFNYGISMAAGLVIMVGVYFVDYSFIGRNAIYLYGGFTAIVIAASLFLPYRNGAKLGLLMPMYLYVPIFAGILYRYRKTGWGGILKCVLFMILPVAAAVQLVPSMRTGCTLLLIFSLMLFLAVWKGWFRVKRKRAMYIMAAFGVGGPAAFTLWGYFFLFAGHQKARFQALFNPFVQSDANYVTMRVRQAMESSRIMGTGGDGSALSGFVPNLDQEYVFISLVYQYGLLLGIAVMALLLVLILRCFHISLRQKNQLGLMLGVGCGLVFFMESAGCILMNFGFGWASTYFLPFFSFGRIASIVYYILLGLLLGVYRYKDIELNRSSNPVRRFFWKVHPDL